MKTCSVTFYADIVDRIGKNLTKEGSHYGSRKTGWGIFTQVHIAHLNIWTRGECPRAREFRRNLRSLWDYPAHGHIRGRGGEEREQLWERMVQIYPPYREYQQKTKREIPVVVLEKQSS
jgi:hypothetical protein